MTPELAAALVKVTAPHAELEMLSLLDAANEAMDDVNAELMAARRRYADRWIFIENRMGYWRRHKERKKRRKD